MTYTPNANFTGLDKICLEICDASGSCDTAEISITVTPVNDVLFANNDVASVNEDGTLNGTTVLVNDGDDDGSILTVNTTPTSDVSNGTLTLNSDGTFKYIPTANFNGTDSFTYEVCNNETPQECTTATVTITVNPVNDVLFANNDTVSVNEDATLIGTTVLVNDGDDDGSTLIVNTNPTVDVSNGTLTINSDGTFEYIPDANFNGTDTFTYEVCNNETPQECTTATVIITVNPVNDIPVAQPDIVSTNENITVIIDVQNNDIDVDGDPLTTSVDVTATNGTVHILNGDSLSYIPNNNFYGNDTIVYSVCDNGIPPLCDMDTVFINVINVNDQPIALNDYAMTDPTAKDTINVLANDTDLDGDDLTVSIVIPPTNGTVIILPDGQIEYTPDPTILNCIDTVYYSICDNGNPSLCDTAMIVIWVPEHELTPIAVDDFATVKEDETVTVDVLFNDADPNIPGDTLTVSISTQPINGTVTVNSDNTITYIPNTNYFGYDTLTYTVCDTSNFCVSANVYFEIFPTNDAPDAVFDTTSVDENSLVTIDVQNNDSDPDGDNLTTSILTLPENGTVSILNSDSIIYTPNPNFYGNDYFIYQICDAGVPTMCDNDTVFITVNLVNNSPVINDTIITIPEDSTFTICFDNLDVDGDVQTISLCSNSNNGTVSLVGNCVTYVPNSNFNGLDSICVIACDNYNYCDTAIINIVITQENDKPVINDTTATSIEGAPITICIPFTDIDGNPDYTPSTDCLHNGIVTNATASSTEVCLTYTPTSGFAGLDTVCVTICDANGACDTAQVEITVTPKAINEKPIITDVTASTPQDSTITICVPFTDVDGVSPYSLSTTCYSNGTIFDAAVGANDVCITYIPNLGFAGNDTICITLCDAGGACENSTIIITVLPNIYKTITRSICNGETFDLGTQTLTSSGTYVENFPLSNGTDSIVTLHLTVNPIYADTISATINEGESYDFAGQICTTAGEYVKVFTTVDGCDSTIVLNLVILPKTLEIPQGFSPNGDGVNDGYVIVGIEDYPNNKLEIFNRWGNLVYRKEHYANDWDGKSTGNMTVGNEILPAGTYFYLLDLGDGSEPKTGYIYLTK